MAVAAGRRVQGQFVMGWAQWVLATIFVLEIVGAFFLHGHPRPPISFGTKVMETAVFALLLHAGGFWK